MKFPLIQTDKLPPKEDQDNEREITVSTYLIILPTVSSKEIPKFYYCSYPSQFTKFHIHCLLVSSFYLPYYKGFNLTISLILHYTRQLVKNKKFKVTT